MTPEEPKRIFVVGCARSGTTLLQAMLSSHPEVLGFPETFYFAHSRASRKHQGISRWWRNRRQSIYALQDALRRLQMSNQFWPTLHLASPEQIDKYFLSLLDTETHTRRKSAWSEKTPGHINFIERITATCPDALFIHVLRDGRDVVASLEDLYRRTPVGKRSATWNLHQSIDQWNRCLEISESHSRDAQHYRIRYESILASTESELRALCRFLKLPFDELMLDYQQSSQQVLGADAQNAWRRDVLKPLQPTHLLKYRKLFSKEEQIDIEARLISGGKSQ